MCLSALRNIEINFAPVRHAGFANFRECHKTCVGLQKAKPVFTDCSCSDYCSQSSLCKPESTWFRFICRFFLENGQERKYLEWEIWPENRQNQNKVVIAAFPIEFHGVQNSKEATSLSAWPVHRLGLAETSFAARTCILWVVHKFSATRNSLKHIHFCVGNKLW